MANYIESNEIARPHRGSKRRGKKPEKLCVRLFLLDPKNDKTTGIELRSKNESKRLQIDGYGPPKREFLNNETKVEFDISMTVEEFKNKLVEIYPKLHNKQFGLLKADDKSEVLEKLNISSSCYCPEDIYYSNLGQGRLYIRCESENAQTTTVEPPPSKRPRNLVTPESPLLVYRAILPKPTTTQSSSTLSVAFNNPVPQQTSGFSAAASPGLLKGTVPIGMTQIMSLPPSTSIPVTRSLIMQNTSSPQQSSGLSEAEGTRIFQNLSSTETTQPMQPGILSSVQNDSSGLSANGLSETTMTSAASPLNALADATVDGGPMNQDEYTEEFQENSSTSSSSSDDFDLHVFVKECQDTGHLEISPKILKYPNLLERLQQPSVIIRSMEIHKHCKLSDVLKVFILPTSLKVLTIKENYLDDSDIKSFVTDVVFKLSNLEELDISNTLFIRNFCSMFIIALPYLTSLKRLCLHNICLAQQDVTCLAAVLRTIKNLEILNLSCKNYNSDEDNDAIILALANLKSLKVLVLSGFKLCGTRAVINEIKSLKSLEKLDLSFNYGGNFSIELADIQQYSFLSNLKVLSLFSNSTMTPQDFSNLVRNLFLCAPLEELILDSNHIGNFICLLCSLPKAVHSLKTLSLANTGIGGSATEGLSCVLSNFRQLQVLNLSSNNLLSNDFQHLQPSLSHLVHLKVLNVSENPGVSSMLQHVLPFLTKLDELSASSCNLRGNEVKTISPVISSLKSLKRLDLSNNKIGSVGANALAEVLPSLPCMEKFDLSGNHMCDEAMHIICVAINSLKHLKSLNLGANQIDSLAVTALADIVSSLDMLEELDINACGLDGNGTKTLLGKRVSLKHLKRLVLSNNKLGVSGISALAQVLPSLISLQELGLENIPLDNECFEHLRITFEKGLVRKVNLQSSTFSKGFASVLQSLQLLEHLVLSFVRNCHRKLFDAMVSLKYLKILELDNLDEVDVTGLGRVLSSLKLLEELTLSNLYLLEYDKISDEDSESEIEEDYWAKLFEGISSLTYLKKLHLSVIDIRESGVKALASALPSLLLLEELTLDNINIDISKKLCTAMVSLKYLKKLDLSGNEIGSTCAAALAGVLPSLQLLEELVLHGISLDEDSAPKLCTAMVSLKYLKKLDLSRNGIGSTGAAALADVLPSLQLLEELVLEDIDLDEDSAPKLCTAMVSLKYLKKLDLSSNEIGSTGAAALAGVLPSLPLLEELVLQVICLDEDSSPKLCTAMVSLKYLKKLDLSSNEIGSTGAAALADVLPSLQLLEELVLEYINLDEDSAPKLCTAMVSLKYLKKLDLSRNEIGSTGAAALAGVLPSLPLLEELVLGYINLEEDSAPKLCTAMVSLKYLKKLDLSGNEIGSTGAAALAGVLPSLPLLEELVLQYINLDEDSAPKLCTAMVSLKYLKKLDLTRNEIGSTGAAALADVLPSLPLLEELVLRDINLDEDSAPKLCTAMVSVKYLKKLDLSDNEIGSTGAAALADVLPSLPLLAHVSLFCRNLNQADEAKIRSKVAPGVHLYMHS